VLDWELGSVLVRKLGSVQVRELELAQVQELVLVLVRELVLAQVQVELVLDRELVLVMDQELEVELDRELVLDRELLSGLFLLRYLVRGMGLNLAFVLAVNLGLVLADQHVFLNLLLMDCPQLLSCYPNNQVAMRLPTPMRKLRNVSCFFFLLKKFLLKVK
jgi:hypothetical protein